MSKQQNDRMANYEIAMDAGDVCECRSYGDGRTCRFCEPITIEPNTFAEISAPFDNGFRIETATMFAVVPQTGDKTAYRAALRADGADVQILVYSARGCFYEVSRGFDQSIIQFMMLADGFIASK